MKKIILSILILALFLSSCVFNKGEVKKSNYDIAKEISSLRDYIPITQTIIGLARGKKMDKIPISKTVNVENIDVLKDKTPDDVYLEYKKDDKDYVRVPSTGYFDNFYGEGSNVRAAFFMTPTTLSDDSTGYLIDLYLEPYLDLSVDYDYEKYKISHDSWDFKLENLIDYKTYLSDGSIVDRDIIEQKEDWNSNVGYAMFDVPAVLSNIDKYIYPEVIPHPATSTNIYFYSHTKSTINTFFSEILSEEFYTEAASDGSINSGITYIDADDGFLWSTKTKTVVRFMRNGNISKSNAFTTTGNIGLIWYSALEEVTIDSTGVDNELTHYKKKFMEWWDEPEYISDDNFSYKEIIEMDELGENRAEYEGTIKKFWNGNNRGNGYHVSLLKDENDNYVFTIDWQWFEATDKSFAKDVIVKTADDEKYIKSFKIIDNELVIQIGDGVFKGHFNNGAFIGKYIIGDKEFENVVINSFGVVIGDKKFRFDKNGNLITI
ncbi:hypothetical protein JCM30566_07540 [Marinitoga arctica]